MIETTIPSMTPFQIGGGLLPGFEVTWSTTWKTRVAESDVHGADRKWDWFAGTRAPYEPAEFSFEGRYECAGPRKDCLAKIQSEFARVKMTQGRRAPMVAWLDEDPCACDNRGSTKAGFNQFTACDPTSLLAICKQRPAQCGRWVWAEVTIDEIEGGYETAAKLDGSEKAKIKGRIHTPFTDLSGINFAWAPPQKSYGSKRFQEEANWIVQQPYEFEAPCGMPDRSDGLRWAHRGVAERAFYDREWATSATYRLLPGKRAAKVFVPGFFRPRTRMIISPGTVVVIRNQWYERQVFKHPGGLIRAFTDTFDGRALWRTSDTEVNDIGNIMEIPGLEAGENIVEVKGGSGIILGINYSYTP